MEVIGGGCQCQCQTGGVPQRAASDGGFSVAGSRAGAASGPGQAVTTQTSGAKIAGGEVQLSDGEVQISGGETQVSGGGELQAQTGVVEAQAGGSEAQASSSGGIQTSGGEAQAGGETQTNGGEAQAGETAVAFATGGRFSLRADGNLDEDKDAAFAAAVKSGSGCEYGPWKRNETGNGWECSVGNHTCTDEEVEEILKANAGG
ncbi:hypothetical protein DRE_03274 [Drechslerella stenobrocha 248]|uniref:Uncharacterized protein n=1 Tax=Drechslerella stenobrocha 248 TaxID=1043628 RepID=W7HVV3_9PEZI|nr:hypothetical protein DRE_03274 [Drechslerella stenobrocha 248]